MSWRTIGSPASTTFVFEPQIFDKPTSIPIILLARSTSFSTNQPTTSPATRLRQINLDRENSRESIPNILLTLYTSAGDVYPIRVKANQKEAIHIDQPHLTLFGTATPQYFYEYLASVHVAENPFHAECLKLIKKLSEQPTRTMQRRQLMRAMKLKAADFDQIVLTLCEQGEIESIIIETATKPARGYQLGSAPIRHHAQ